MKQVNFNMKTKAVADLQGLEQASTHKQSRPSLVDLKDLRNIHINSPQLIDMIYKQADKYLPGVWELMTSVLRSFNVVKVTASFCPATRLLSTSIQTPIRTYLINIRQTSSRPSYVTTVSLLIDKKQRCRLSSIGYSEKILLRLIEEIDDIRSQLIQNLTHNPKIK